jgi:hypothetical protein
VKFNLLPDTELLEHFCDNNKWTPDAKRDSTPQPRSPRQ